MFSQFKNKPLFSDRGDKGASRVNSSTFVYLLIEYYLSEMGNSDYNKMKALGEQLGPRIYEALHYSKENKYSYKRFLTPLESIKFIAMAVTIESCRSGLSYSRSRLSRAQ